MKLLLVNGNTTQAVTDRVVAEATRCAAPGTAITGVTARFGVSIVSTEAENEIAGPAVLDALAAHGAGHDAAILAISFDTALLAARQTVSMPVIGMTEASLLTACLLGRRFGLISFGQSSRSMYLDLVQRSGLSQRMAGCETIVPANTAAYLREGAQDAAVIDASKRLITADADTVVVAGAAVAGIAYRLRAQVAVPLLDGIACAVGQAEALLRLELRQRPSH
jgi:allantoin racemase